MADNVNNLKATPLDFTTVYPNIIALDFDVPFDKTIRIIDWNYIQGEERTYYGDEIDLRFWRMLKMPFGSSNDPENPLTLQEGYIYKYYFKTKVFDVYDDTGTKIIHKTNVRTIAQMNIDFTIHKSHQFWIVAPLSLDGFYFMFPVFLKEDKKHIDIETVSDRGVNNEYLPDRVRPYGKNDEDNPSWNIKYLANYYDKYLYLIQGFLDVSSSWNLRKDLSAVYLYDIDYKDLRPSNYFYNKVFYEFSAKKKLSIKEARLFGAMSLLYMQLGIGLYPDLMPIQREGETQNNRPVYEPWLIWGVLKFLYNKRTVDWDEDVPIPYFDLSPAWA